MKYARFFSFMNIRSLQKTLFILFVIILVPFSASAHFHETDGGISILLHVNPDDDPIVGELATFFVEIRDQENRFKPEQCECSAEILRNGETLLKTKLFQSQADNILASPVFSYTFPESDIYNVTVTGNPSVKNAFQPFQIEYDLRVAREDSGGKNNSLWLVLGGAAGIVIVSTGLIQYLKRTK